MKLSFWQYTTIGLLLIVVLLTACNACQRSKIVKLEKDCGEKLVREDSIIYRDTGKIVFDTSFVPKPYRFDVPVPVYIDTGNHEPIFAKVDTAAILKNYYSTAHYSEHIDVTDSSTGKKAGEVNLQAQITQNRFKQLRLYGHMLHDSVTIAKTRTIEAKQKNSVWLGINGQWSNGMQSVGPSLFFLQKRGWGIEAGALINTKGELSYQAGMKFKIHL